MSIFVLHVSHSFPVEDNLVSSPHTAIDQEGLPYHSDRLLTWLVSQDILSMMGQSGSGGGVYNLEPACIL